MIPVRLSLVPHHLQRYDTCGDYFLVPSDFGRGPMVMQFMVSQMSDWRSEAAVFLHEFVEAMICQKRGVSLEEIDAWDFAHADAKEPGMLEGCPYKWAHQAAEQFEREFLRALDLGWKAHEEIVENATREFRPERSLGADRGVGPGGEELPAGSGDGLRDEQAPPARGAADGEPEER